MYIAASSWIPIYQGILYKSNSGFWATYTRSCIKAQESQRFWWSILYYSSLSNIGISYYIAWIYNIIWYQSSDKSNNHKKMLFLKNRF